MSKAVKLPRVDTDAQAVFCKDCSNSLGRVVSVDVPIALYCHRCKTWTSADTKVPHPLAVKPGGWRG